VTMEYVVDGLFSAETVFTNDLSGHVSRPLQGADDRQRYIIIYTVGNLLAEHAQIFDMDQTAVEQTGERVHVHGGHAVHPGQVQSRRAGEHFSGLRVGVARRARRSSVIMCRGQYRLAIRGRAGIRSGTRPVRDDTARRRQNTREIHGWLFRILPARKLQTFGCLAHRYTKTLCYRVPLPSGLCVWVEFSMEGVRR